MSDSTSPIPEYLSYLHASGLSPGQPIAQYEIGSYKNFVYLILDWQTKQAAWVDPQSDLTAPLQDLKQNGFELTTVLLTHSHFDHVAGLKPLLKLFPHISFRVHPKDVHRLTLDQRNSLQLILTEDLCEFNVGSIRLTAFHTPGHSAGALTYWVHTENPGYILSGDTVFIKDCGRTDFPDGSNDQMFNTLCRYKTFPDSLVLLPGHHYAKACASTLASEFRESPPFQCTSVSQLAALP